MASKKATYPPGNRPSSIQLDAASEKRFQSLWQGAIDSYKKDTGRDLLELVQLRGPPTTSSVDELFDKEDAEFKNSRAEYQEARNILKKCVTPIEVLSDVAKSALSLTPFAPAATVFGAGIFLLGACDKVSKAYDCVTQLFTECHAFTLRLKVYSQTVMDQYFFEKLTAVLRCLLETFAQCEKIVASRRAKLFWEYMFGEKNKLLNGKADELNKHFKHEEQLDIALIYVAGQNTVSELNKIVARLDEERSGQKQARLREDIDKLPLGPLDVVAKQNEESRKHANSKPDWILQDEVFLAWDSEVALGGPAWLWGMGNAGAGKTSLVSFLSNTWQAQIGPMDTIGSAKHYAHVESGETQQPSLSYTAVALFYCSFRSIGRQGPDAIFQSLVHQLLTRLHELEPSRVEKRLKQIEQLRSIRTSTGLSWTGVLDNVISEFQRTYVIIDALDETEDGYDELLLRLSRLTSPSLRLLVTSRDEPSMRADLAMTRKAFGKALPLTIRAKDDFIQSYVEARLLRIRDDDGSSEAIGSSALPKSLREDEELMPQIIEKIVKAAEGNFYYAELQITSLKAEKESKDIVSKLENLAEKSLPGIIHEAITRIDEQSDRDMSEIGMKALMWATYAGSALTIEELRHALALTIRPHIHEDLKAHTIEVERLSQSVVVEASRFFLRVDNRANNEQATVQVHKAIKDYCDHANTFKDAHYQMAETCLVFLDRRSFSLRCNSEDDLRRLKSPFYKYAARHWGLHMKKAGEKRFLGPTSLVSVATLLNRRLFLNCLAVALRGDLQNLRMWNWHHHDSWRELRDSHEPMFPPPHLLTFYDLPQTLDWWLRQNPSSRVNQRSPTGTTPLYLACSLGRVRVLESLLFDFNADPTLQGALPKGFNLAAAVFAQSPEVIERLLYVNAKGLVSQPNWHNKYPLSEAAKRENPEIVRMITEAISALPNGEEILTHQETNDGWTALHDAALSPLADERIIKILVNAKGGRKLLHQRTHEKQNSALHIAAQEGNAEVVKTLLELGADPMDRQKAGKTPLHYAVEGLYDRNAQVIKILLESEKMVHDAQDEGGSTTWHLAAINRRHRNLGLLIEKTNRSLFHTKDLKGMIPIRTGINRGQNDCFDVFLESFSGQLTADDAYPVFNSLVRDHSEPGQRALKRLLEKPVHPMPLHHGKTTVLHRVVDEGTLDAVKFTWQCFPSKEVLEYHDAAGSTALILATKIGSFEKVCFLMDQGADLNAQDDTGRTPLHHAVERDMSDLAAQLLDRHADYHIKDKSGITSLERASAQNSCRKLWQLRAAIRTHPVPPAIQYMCVSAENRRTYHVVGDEATKKKLLEQGITKDTLSVKEAEYLRSDPIPPDAKLPILRVDVSIAWRTDETRDQGDLWHDLCIVRNGHIERRHMYCGFVEGRHSHGSETQTHRATWHLERGLEELSEPDTVYGPRVDKQQRIKAFVRALRNGDRVAIVPMAAGSAATNTIEHADVKIFYED